MRTLPAALALIATACTTLPATPQASEFGGANRFDLSREDIRTYVEATSARTGLEADELYRLIARAEPQPKIIEAMERPAEKVSPWWEYRAKFLTEQRIREGTAFWLANREMLERVGAEHGVAPEYIVAILGVETYYGRITGKWRVIDALATLAFDYPPRSKFFSGELAQFAQLVKDEGLDPLTALGSYAGAMGAPQFMPSSYRAYAIDEDQDGRRDLFGSWDDVVGSVANYFREHKWTPGGLVLIEAQWPAEGNLVLDTKNLTLNETIDSARAKGVRFESGLPGSTPVILIPAEGKDAPGVRIGFSNFITITRYNRSVRYAMAVHDLAQALKTSVAAASVVAPAASPESVAGPGA